MPLQHRLTPALVPLVEFAIKGSVSPLGTGYAHFYADRSQHPRRSLTPPAAPDPEGSGEAAAHRMWRATAEARALLQERQDRRKEELDAFLWDVRFRCGGRGAAGHGAHAPTVALAGLPAVDGPLPGPRAPAPNACRLDLPAARRVFPEFSVERLRPLLIRPDRLGGDSDAGPPSPAAGPDGVPEH